MHVDEISRLPGSGSRVVSGRGDVAREVAAVEQSLRPAGLKFQGLDIDVVERIISLDLIEDYRGSTRQDLREDLRCRAPRHLLRDTSRGGNSHQSGQRTSDNISVFPPTCAHVDLGSVSDDNRGASLGGDFVNLAARDKADPLPIRRKEWIGRIQSRRSLQRCGFRLVHASGE